VYLDPKTALATIEQLGRERRAAARDDRIARRRRREHRRTAIAASSRGRPTAAPRPTPVVV
jgi:hypothetical protein